MHPLLIAAGVAGLALGYAGYQKLHRDRTGALPGAGPQLLPATGPGSPPPQDAVTMPAGFDATFTGTPALGASSPVRFTGPEGSEDWLLPVVWVAPDANYVVVDLSHELRPEQSQKSFGSSKVYARSASVPDSRGASGQYSPPQPPPSTPPSWKPAVDSLSRNVVKTEHGEDLVLWYDASKNPLFLNAGTPFMLRGDSPSGAFGEDAIADSYEPGGGVFFRSTSFSRLRAAPYNVSEGTLLYAVADLPPQTTSVSGVGGPLKTALSFLPGRFLPRRPGQTAALGRPKAPATMTIIPRSGEPGGGGYEDTGAWGTNVQPIVTTRGQPLVETRFVSETDTDPGKTNGWARRPIMVMYALVRPFQPGDDPSPPTPKPVTMFQPYEVSLSPGWWGFYGKKDGSSWWRRYADVHGVLDTDPNQRRISPRSLATPAIMQTPTEAPRPGGLQSPGGVPDFSRAKPPPAPAGVRYVAQGDSVDAPIYQGTKYARTERLYGPFWWGLWRGDAGRSVGNWSIDAGQEGWFKLDPETGDWLRLPGDLPVHMPHR